MDEETPEILDLRTTDPSLIALAQPTPISGPPDGSSLFSGSVTSSGGPGVAAEDTGPEITAEEIIVGLSRGGLSSGSLAWEHQEPHSALLAEGGSIIEDNTEEHAQPNGEAAREPAAHGVGLPTAVPPIGSIPTHPSYGKFVPGLSTTHAVKLLVRDLKNILEDQRKQMVQWKGTIKWARLYLASVDCWCLLISAGLLVASFSQRPTAAWEHIVCAVIVFATAVLNGWLLARRMFALRWEAAARVAFALSEFKNNIANGPRGVALLNHFTTMSILLQESETSATSVLAYRDRRWVFVPSMLLVRGDVVAASSSAQLPAPATRVTDHDARYMDPLTREQTAAVLRLGGDLHVYKLTESPCRLFVEKLLAPDACGRIEPLFITRLRAIAYFVQVCMLVCVSAYLVLLFVVWFGAPDVVCVFPLGLLAQAILCWAPSSMPLLMTVTEALGTAQLMGVVEAVLIRSRWKAWCARGQLDEMLGIRRLPHDIDGAHLMTSDDVDMQMAMPPEEAKYEHPSVKRMESKHWALVPPDRFFYYLRSALRHPLNVHQSLWHSEIPASTFCHDDTDLGFGVRPSGLPPLSTQLVYRLASITALAYADLAPIITNDPVPQMVFVMKGEHSSAILDVHADYESSTGLRFEDKNWKSHIASLKPIGLACFLRCTQSRHLGAQVPGAVDDPAWETGSFTDHVDVPAPPDDRAVNMAPSLQTMPVASDSALNASAAAKLPRVPRAAMLRSQVAKGLQRLRSQFQPTGAGTPTATHHHLPADAAVAMALEQVEAGSDYGDEPIESKHDLVHEALVADAGVESRPLSRQLRSSSAPTPGTPSLHAQAAAQLPSDAAGALSPLPQGAASPPNRAGTPVTIDATGAHLEPTLIDQPRAEMPSVTSTIVRDTASFSLANQLRHIRPPMWLLPLAKQIGFTEVDVSTFEHRTQLHVVQPQPARPELFVPHSTSEWPTSLSPRDDMMLSPSYILPEEVHIPMDPVWKDWYEYRMAALSPTLTSMIVRDRRTQRLQLLTLGEPAAVLARCTEYWDGKAIWPMVSARRDTAMQMYRQWKSEDFQCIAFAYDPISDQEAHMLNMLLAKSSEPVAAVSNFSVLDTLPIGLGVTNNSVVLMPAVPPPSVVNEADRGGVSESKRHVGDSRSPSPIRRVPMPLHLPSTPLLLAAPPSLGAAESTTYARLARRVETQLHVMQSRQVFTGMLAARTEPIVKVQALVKQLTDAGVRFVFVTDRNYREVKPLAAKMGLDTGWNCAISLSDTLPEQQDDSEDGETDDDTDTDTDTDDDEDMPEGVLSDQQRRQALANQVEDVWDMKAQLPHGLARIRRHLKVKDNVPLLVSIFTDSTPPTWLGMLRIMQENGEMVAMIGSALVSSNQLLFNSASVAFSVAPPQFGHTEASLVTVAKTDPFLLLASRIHSLHSAIQLPCYVLPTFGSSLLFSARKSYANLKQCLTFACASQCMLYFIILFCLIAVIPPAIPMYQTLWFIWVQIPLLSLPMMASPAEQATMSHTRTPEKNVSVIAHNQLAESLSEQLYARPQRLAWWVRFIRRFLTVNVASYASGTYENVQEPAPYQVVPPDDSSRKVNGWRVPVAPSWVIPPELRRFVLYFFCRFLPGAAAAIGLFTWVLYGRGRQTWRQCWDDTVAELIAQAQATVSLGLVFWYVAQSATFLYRTESIVAEKPWRNRPWVYCSIAVIALQILFNVITNLAFTSDGFLGEITWEQWLVMVIVWPGITIAWSELVKKHDKREFEYEQQEQWLKFDTKLGMHSPK